MTTQVQIGLTLSGQTGTGSFVGSTGATLVTPTSLGVQQQALNMNTHAINNLTDPVNAQDAATKNYVDTIATGGAQPCYAASTANLTSYTYLNGVSGVGATLMAPGNGIFTVDGVNPPVGSRFLYKNDTTGSGAYNGIYTVTVSNAGLPAVLTRAIDYDTVNDINDTGLIPVTNGTVNANSAWYNTTTMVTVGTTALTFVQFGTPLALPVSLANGGTGQSLSSVNSAVFSTTSGGAAQLSTTLPSGLSATNIALTTPTLGTPSSGTLTNCTGYTVANLTDVAWTDISGSIGLGGFSGSPTVTYAKSKVIGKTIWFSISVTGTSNANTFTVTSMPKTANSAAGGGLGVVSNNGANTITQGWSIAASGTTLTLYNAGSSTGWSTSGTKAAQFQGFYETT